MTATRLPLLRPHGREHTFCTYCPKLCRFACPVSTVQGRETTTPWGKMSSVHHVAHRHLELHAEHAATWYACTGCMRCRTFCDHDNEVARTLGAARAEALRAGVAPRPARALLRCHDERKRRARAAARRVFGDKLTRDARVVFAPGCTACVTASHDASATLRAVETLTGKAVRVEADGCCGLPLLDAGDPDGFLREARRFTERVSSAELVVFADPGCLHALTVLAPALGLRPRGAMRHVAQLAASALGRLGHVGYTGPVRYHDPCRLGRGMGIYEEPRAVLEKMLGRAPDEFSQNRDRAECCGAGGQLPATDPTSAEAIARERLTGHELEGGGRVVTACPACRRAFSKAGARTVDLGAMIAQSLGHDVTHDA